MPFPLPEGLAAGIAWLVLAVVAVVVGVVIHRWLTRREIATGVASYPLVAGFAAAIIIGAASWLVISLAGGAPFVISQPAPQGTFGRIAGGFTISGGLLALQIGLVLYTSSFIAEIVRAGIQSVGRGQTEASRALGLSPMGTLRNVTFPQALRVIIPPLISQFLNLTKNSSLAAAIGYSDLTSVAKTMTQTAPAVSIFILIMAAYLAMSLSYSLIGNLYNRRIRIVGR
jgi:general L-amino acid transport system permease protein